MKVGHYKAVASMPDIYKYKYMLCQWHAHVYFLLKVLKNVSS